MDPISTSEADVEAAWSIEIERRLVEIDAGTVELIAGEDVRAELFGESESRTLAAFNLHAVLIGTVVGP